MALTPLRAARLLIADLDPDRQYVTDDQVNAYLDLNDQNVRRTAADLLDAIATSEALVMKVITTQDLATDGSKLAAELRARADRFRAQADALDGGLSVDVFDVADTGRGRPCYPEHTHGTVCDCDGPWSRPLVTFDDPAAASSVWGL